MMEGCNYINGVMETITSIVVEMNKTMKEDNHSLLPII
jgi:hypothetical protein